MYTALFPMKLNSSRVPNKNFKLLGNKPLLLWMLEKLASSEKIASIVINTDASDQLEEMNIPRLPKVSIRERARHICGDDVSMNKVIEDDLGALAGEHFFMTHTTNPFLSVQTINRAIVAYEEGLKSGSHDSLFSVNALQGRFYSSSGTPINHHPDILLPTQQLTPIIEENSCLYVFSKTSFKKTKARIGKHPYMYETPPLESIDIDNPEDWMLASALADYWNNHATT